MEAGPRSRSSPHPFSKAGEYVRIAGKLAFLADARTFRESERMLETVEAYRWGKIVGAVSGGNFGNANWSNLPGGWTLSWKNAPQRHRDSTHRPRGKDPSRHRRRPG